MGKCEEIFNKVKNNASLEDSNLDSSEICIKLWEEYQKLTDAKNKSINGKIFEKIITYVLDRNDIKPYFYHVYVKFVDNAIFDIILYSTANIIYALSVK